MADTPPKSPPAADAPSNSNEPSGYARLARKWSRLSSNLLASGLVIVAAIALIKYVVPWWKQDEPPSAGAHLAETLGQGVETEDPHGVLSGFGELSHSLRQARFVGDRAGSREKLRQICRQAAQTLQQSNRIVGPAEQRILNRLRTETPVAEEAGKWHMYETDGPAPIVAIVPWSHFAEPGDQAGSASTGVLSWGIAVPDADSSWTIFVYPGSGVGHSSIPGLPQVELPTGTIKTMSLASENGGALLGFSGSIDPAACRAHFDRWAATTNTPQAAPWRKIGPQWMARFGKEDIGWVDVHLFEEDGRSTGGFVAVSGINSADE
jgi:hypothetical protein